MKLDSSLITRAVPPGSMRYYAWLYTPEAQRDFLAALFLIETELHDSARAAHEVAHVRLQWWREEIERLIEGRALHPATQVLQHVSQLRSRRFDGVNPERSRRAQQPETKESPPKLQSDSKPYLSTPVTEPSRSVLDFQLLHQTLLSAAQELANVTFETDAELSQYLRGGLGALFTLFAEQSVDAPSAQLLTTASQIGAFVRQTEITRDLRQDFHHGRLFLPLVTLDELSIEYEALQKNEWPEVFVQLLKSRSAQQLTAYHALQHSLSSTDREALRPLLVLGDLHVRLLQAIASDPVTHTQQRLELGPIQKLWTAWRSARAAR
jgi:15-cis-phytoene synthase